MNEVSSSLDKLFFMFIQNSNKKCPNEKTRLVKLSPLFSNFSAILKIILCSFTELLFNAILQCKMYHVNYIQCKLKPQGLQ